VLIVLLGLAFVASRSCQQDQVRVTKEQAIATAERQIDFEPTRTQVRLLRQGLNSKPFWIVSLSIPVGEELDTQEFRELAVVRIDANTGKVEDVKVQR
jgi:Peptidase propeptide and YPEB domain